MTKDKAVISAWSLREVYFDEDGEPSMHRSPPQRPWVGLTDGEIREIHSASAGKDVGFVTGLTEAKLKELNHG